jgi:hypothetical protein
MKVLFTFLFVLVCALCRGNAIDSLKTDDDVRAFLQGRTANRDDYDILANGKPFSNEKLSTIKYLKIDLNNDGLTDLIVNGSYLFAVVDAGNGHFKTEFIDRGAFYESKYALADVHIGSGLPEVIVRKLPGRGDDEIKLRYDTLIMGVNGFVEYNGIAENDIEEISLSTTGCLGECPIFELTVGSDGTAVFNAIEYNDHKGKLQCEIDTASLARLFHLANYIHPRLLRNEYAVNWTDDQTATLTITFKDGTTKTIKDYGMIGTFGLERLYNLIFRLRKSQKWEHQ